MILILLSLIGFVSGSCFDSWPNGTASALNYWNCDADSITFLKVETYLVDGITHTYPVSLQEPLLLKTQVNNHGDVLSDGNIKTAVAMYQYVNVDATTCAWSYISNYGTMDDATPCKDSFACPIQLGQQSLNIIMDFTKLPPATLQMLRRDGDLQIQYRIYDNNYKNKACLMLQMRADYH